jgi:hypothetical protein
MPLHRRTLLSVTFAMMLALGVAGPALADPHVGDPPDDEPGVLATDPPQRTFTYEIQTRGTVGTDLSAFAADAAAILGDARSWTLGGSVAIEPVSSGGDFNLVLASPQAVDAAHEVCSPAYSCRVGDDVLINDDNWRDATPAWRDTGAPLWQYRQYLINHEVGHFLGFGHPDCGGAGQLAPVMHQQSISLDGCEPNGWPLEWEREQLGDRLGVPVYGWVFPDVLASDTHRDTIHAIAAAGIAEGYDDGFYRPDADIPRDQMATFLARALDLTAEEPPRFDDVWADRHHATSIAAIDEAGIAEGYEDGTYRPRLAVSRAHMATFIARAYGLSGSGEPSYEDVSAGHTHAENIAAVTEAGIAEGYADGTFRPARSVSRAEMASLLARAEGLAG